MKNHVKVQTVVVAVLIYLWALAVAINGGVVGVILTAVYCAACIAGANALLASDLAATTQEAETFSKYRPLRGLGSLLTEFQYVYYKSEDLLADILLEFNTRIARQGFGGALQKKNYTDVDKHLLSPETREFHVAASEKTGRGTQTFLVVHLRRHADAQSVQWWVTMRGDVDRNKKFTLLASAPVAMPVWLWQKWNQRLDLASSVRSVYNSFYNSLDVNTDGRSWHLLVFDALADALEKHGVDISDLKQQRAQVMNINVSGGQTRFGNVVLAGKQANVAHAGAGK
jgi:hypothetical protein